MEREYPNYQKAILTLLGSRTIAYNAELARFLGSVKAAILLCQLLYWHGKGEDDPEWFFKTIEELYEETGLTRYEQDSAIRKCKKRGFIEVRKKGIPSKRYFRVNLERLASELSKSYKL